MAKILVVEDDQFTRELYQQILRDAGFEVEAAKDGQEGWEKASQGGYDLILLDIMMPKIDGIALLKRLKATPPAIANKKIVMLTVLNQDTYIKDALTSGADGYLMKTALTPDQVLAEVRNVLHST